MAKLLCWVDDESLRPKGGKEVVASLAGPVSIAYKEPAGYAFQQVILRQQGLLVIGGLSNEGVQSDEESIEASSPKTCVMPGDDQPPPDVNWKGTKKKKIKDGKKKSKDSEDLYALLGLKNERWTADANQLKNAYRKVCLEHHPDKRLAGVEDEAVKEKIENYFKSIQEAYKILSDPVRRREYDSVDEFDDSLPSECATQDFFKVFAPAFRRNARWSVDQEQAQALELGDEQTPYEKVEKFYNFWFQFRSWREFPHPDEEEVESAESREERRWIDRHNSKLREKGKKDEGKRLREFVDNAYRIDPRVVKKKEEDRIERDRKKNEKEEAKRLAAEEESNRAAAEEAARLAALVEEKSKAEEAKKNKEAAKKAMKKERQRMRMINEGEDGSDRLLDEDDVEKLTQKMDFEALKALCDALSAFGLSREQQREEATRGLESISSKAEMELRAKELQKKAAEKIAREAADVEHKKKLAMMKEWDEEEMRMLDKALVKFPIGTAKRWDQVTAYVRTRTLEEVTVMVKERQGMLSARSKQAEDFKFGQKKRAEVTSTLDLRDHAFTDVQVNISTASESKADGEWSEEQELALIKAIKEIGKDAGAERWDKVAEVVPGKTKVQCFKHFKELKEIHRGRKAAAGDEVAEDE